MPEAKKASHFFRDMRGVPAHPARRVLPSLAASVPADTVNHASAACGGSPSGFWRFGTRSKRAV
ncbi:MAG: hypothetical protein WAM29_07425, partial [Methylocella sp.]